MTKIFVHIGYHKTGTTRIQQVFASSPDVNLLSRSLCQRLLLESSPYGFDIKFVERELGKHIKYDKVNVISDEELSGNIHSGGNGRSVTFEIIDRLSKFEKFDVHLILCIRNQVNMIDSCYRQYVKKGGCDSLANYLYPGLLGKKRFRFPGFSFEHFKYSDVVKHGYRALGVNNVSVLVYEQIKKSIEKPFFQILEVQYPYESGTDTSSLVNRSYSSLSLRLARITNRFCAVDPICTRSIFKSYILYSLLRKLYNRISTRSSGLCFGDRVKKEIEYYYANDNAYTSRIINVDLESFGYSVSNVMN